MQYHFPGHQELRGQAGGDRKGQGSGKTARVLMDRGPVREQPRRP